MDSLKKQARTVGISKKVRRNAWCL